MRTPQKQFNTGATFRATVFWLIVWLSAASVSAPGDTVVGDGTIFTSLVRLIARPELYEGKEVEIIGYCVLAPENRSLYLSAEDARSGNTQNALWLTLSTNKTAHVDRKVKSGTVEVIGTFHAISGQGVGHMGMWPGELKNVRFLQRRR